MSSTAFFTFQIDRPKESHEGTIQTIFTTDKDASNEGFLFKIRSEYSNAYSDQVQQGMRLSLIDQDGAILADGSTIDENEGMVLLEYHQLQAGKTYHIKYDFFEKQLSEGNEVNDFQYSASLIQCQLPFITQELLIQDKRLVKSRIAKYNNNKDQDALSIENFKCNFDTFNNTQDSEFGEEGISCASQTYTYQIKKTPMELVKLFEKPFQIRGAKNELITYWYEMVIGYNFMVGSGIKVLLTRTDIDFQNPDDPFQCLYDKSCVMAQMSNKNEIKFDLILTSGEYKLIFFDQSKAETRQFLNQEGGLSIIPLTFKLTAYPVLQNEERVNCPYMFLDQKYIQHRFIEGMQGQRFAYKDKIEINPEVDSLLKVQVKEAYGVNAAISLNSGTDCITNSMQIGTSELLLYPVKKGQTYTVDLSYSNSIITLANFFQCPHLNLEVSMISSQEATQIISNSQCSHQDELESERGLNTIFNSLVDNIKGYTFQNYTQIFKFNVDQTNNDEKTQNYEVTSRKFALNQTMQLFIEIFYEPYLYDLELYLESDEADLVRSHLYKALPKVDWSLYKGSKSIFVELEPGMYDIKIIQKLPGIFADITHYQPKCINFQLRVILQEVISNQYLVPNSLNYYGYLGPEGKNFGQMVYYCQDCILQDSSFYYIEFTLAEDNNVDVNFDATLESEGKQVEISFEGITKDQLSINTKESQDKIQGKIKGQKHVTQQGQQEREETISQDHLSNNAYRIALINQKFQQTPTAKYTLRIDFQERVHKYEEKKFREILPTSIEEIMRDKIKTEGQKESEFFIGSRFMMNFLNQNAIHPFIPKSDKVYQAKYKSKQGEDSFFFALPFSVKEEESQVFAFIYEYTGIAGLSISIYSDPDSDKEDEFEIKSKPGKYHSFLSPFSLTRGNYYLVIEPETLFPYETDAIIRFGIDFVLVRENTTDISQDIVLNAMELCGLPSLPRNFNSPQYIHPLNGYQMQLYEDYKIDELLLSSSLDFVIEENSLVVFYLSVPKDMNALAEISKTKGTNKMKVSTKELNAKSDNFLKHKDLSHLGVIEFREFLNPGAYQIKIFGYEPEEINFITLQRCQSFRIGLSVSPIMYAQTKLEQPCQNPTSLQSRLEFDKLNRGTLVYDLTTNIIDTAHIITEKDGEGPFLFYFQIAYDSQLEGALALTLNKYDPDTLNFEEVQVFNEQDSTSWVMAIIEEGTYVLAIQSLSSTPNKFIKSGLGTKPQHLNINTLAISCLTVQYSYFITSMTQDDAKIMPISFFDLLATLFTGSMPTFDSSQDKYDQQIRNDLHNIHYANCRYNDIPSQLQHSQSGFDQSYTFLISKKNFEIIEILTEVDQILRIHILSHNHKNNINAFLYENSAMTNLNSYTESSNTVKEIFTYLKGQKKAYRLKIVYDSLDESDQCPLYDFRISMKPISNLAEENLQCNQQQMPPDSIAITTKGFYMTQEYAISSDLISKHSNKVGLTYDIDITLPHFKYYFDIEIQYDFLTTKMNLVLFGKTNDKQLVQIADTEIINEQSIGDVDKDENRDNYIKKEVKRLRVYNDELLLGEKQELTNSYVMRLKFYSKQMNNLVDLLNSKSQANKNPQLCFSFDLSMVATEINEKDMKLQTNNNELIRADFSTKLQSELFDTRQKLVVFLQFMNSIKEDYKMLKFQPFVYLVEEKSNDLFLNRIYPITTRLSTVDQSQLVITFKHESLDRGKCYILKVDEVTLGFGHKLNPEPKICTSNCVCNTKGTKGCQEATGICECHYPYLGQDCTECQSGYVFDKTINECVFERKCKEQGGDIDCNGHGTCMQDEFSGQARCECDEGFLNDGYDYCSRCKDPLFTYPDCSQRTWILEPSNVNCKDLPYKMPSLLYKNSSSQDLVYQNEEGFLYWAATYRLVNDNLRTESKHYFTVQQNSVFRLYIDTMQSGVQVKYTVLDDNKKIVLSSVDETEYIEVDTIFTTLQQSELHNGVKKPFTLVFEYRYDKELIGPDFCPMLEIYLIAQPLSKIYNYLQCSSEEIQDSKQLKQFSWQLGSQSKHITEHFTLTSDMKSTDLNSYISYEDENFIIISYQLKIDYPGNALSIFASYDFETVIISLTLLDSKTNNVIAIEKFGSLEDIDTQSEVVSMDNDMISYLEIPEIDDGLYEVQLIISKGLFLPSSQHKTCLSFDFTLEYVARSRYQSDSQPYEVISVFPSEVQQINKQKGLKMQVKFNQALDLDSMISNQNEINHICYLENLSNSNKVIYPHKTIIQPQDSLEIYFNFKDYKVPEDNNCFKLRCSTLGNVGSEQIRPIDIQTNYCFTKESVLDNQVKCNPWALPKVVDNKCICSHPYKGTQCEQCEFGYIETKDEREGSHTICVLDFKKCSRDICNNHGKCLKNPSEAKENDFICQCDDKYNGQYCEKCKDQQFAYPDCDKILSDIYNPVIDKEYLNKRQYNMNGYQKNSIDKDTIFSKKQQCSFINYPQDLDKVEFFGMLGGPMHIAEYYTIHHDQDNIIKFTPQSQGTIKIFAQQPEQTELIINDQIFDIEIGIYDITKDKFVASSINHYIDMGTLNGKMEYTITQYQIPYEYVNHTLYIMFRAVNYSITDEDQINSCQQVYLEIEFSETQRECKYAKQPQQSNDIILVTQDQDYSKGHIEEILSIYNSKNQFFFYQDFYLADYNDEDTDYTMTVSLEQKFIEKNTIDFVIEVLQNDVEFQDIDKNSYNYQDKPKCNDICLISGQKTFNAFQNSILLSSKVYFRFWLFQTQLDGQCANFQLFLNIKKTVNKESNINLRCEELDLPNNLNIPRYLGNGQQQQAFHYLEKYRVDNLRNHTSHRIVFELKEPTLVRFVGLVHKHIEFDIELIQILPNQKSKNLVNSNAKNFEDSIFAQLDTGKYYIKIIFATDEFYLKRPCQFIELDISMMPISQVRKLNLNMMSDSDTQPYTLQDVLQSKNNLLQVVKKNAINTFEIDSLQQQTFQSFTTLYHTRLTLPSKKNLGFLLIVQSDFLFNDINFALTNVKTNQIYHNIRKEISNKLVVNDIPGGEYELLIYAHHCLTNMQSGYISSLVAKYQIDFNFVDWVSSGIFMDHYNISYSLDNQSLNAPSGDDSLRIIVDRPNTQIKIFSDSNQNNPIGQSYSVLNGEVQILLVKNLKPQEKYIIAFEFSQDSNYFQYENEPCQEFKLQILSTSSQDKCLSKFTQNNPSQIDITSNILSQEIVLNLEKNNLNQRLIVQDDNTDIEIFVDHSEQLYIPTIQLNKNIIESHALDKKDIQKSKIEEIKTKEEDTEIKNLIKYKYTNLKKGNYILQVLQYKPNNCYTQVRMRIDSYQSQEKTAILEKEHFGQMKVYTAAQDIQDQNRYVSSLPISLDTYKYIKEEQYLLLSDYVLISSDPNKNTFTFTVEQSQTFIRFYIETDELMISLIDQTRKIILQEWRSGTIKAMLDQGLYEIKLDFFTPFAKKKAELIEEKIHFTILYSNKEIHQDRYKKAQGSALTNCERNTNFPLALNKKTDKALGVGDAVYDYPLLRISRETMESKFLIDSYSFRVNETSRFYMQIGMHLVNHQVVIALSDLKNFGNSFAAKQQFNLNILDIVLAPGDYALIIDQPTMLDNDEPPYCGIFSYQSRITPLKYLNQQKGETSQSKCEIKEVLPFKIYASESNTKNGEEFFINSQGTFFRMFENILFRKSYQSQVMPEFDRIQFTPKEDGIISLMFQYKKKGNQVLVKLYDGFLFQLVETPLYHKTADVSDYMIEEMISFKLARDHNYVLIIYYQGEINYNKEGREQCEYYNLAISINSVSYLQKALSCVEKSKTIKNFVTDLPVSINDRDFNNGNQYKLQSFMEFKYPQDFDELSRKEEKDFLVKGIDISLSDKFSVESNIKFDFPEAVFETQMFDLIQDKDNSQYSQLEEVSIQLPFSTYGEDIYQETLIRQFRANDLQQNKKYILAYSESTARFVFDYVKEHQNEKKDLCLYIDLELKITKQPKPQQANVLAMTPQILSIYPSRISDSPIMIDKDQKEIKISLEFSENPSIKKQQQNGKITAITETEFTDLVSIQFINPSTNQLLYQRKPMRVVKEKGNNHVWTFIFNVQEEQKNQQLNANVLFAIALNQLVNEKGKQFTLKDQLIIPQFQFQAHLNHNQVQKQAADHVSQIQKEKNQEDLTKTQKEQEVKCLCVHGKCPKGSQYCDKCDPGWEGKLCDIKTQAKNINRDEGKLRNFKKSQLDKRNNKPIQQSSSSEDNSWFFENSFIKDISQQIKYSEPVEYMNHKKLSSQSMFSTIGHFIWQLLSIAVVAFVIVLGCYFISNQIKLRRGLRDYLPVQNNDNDENSPQQVMELMELKPNKKTTQKAKGQKSPEYTNLNEEEDDDDEEHRILQNELMLYADTSEQDQAVMMQSNSPDLQLSQQQKSNSPLMQQPQQINEADTIKEIENVLKEMEQEEDDDSEEDSHFKKYF